ncbi:MAG TPA: protein kinase [Xanthomonadaceae bacterium]|nr:protein kinase [Xanthomonadaceae bacterium]
MSFPTVIEIPGYRIVRQLGSGGMSTVYLAIQASVDREVALKVMAPALAADPRYSERFLREARIAARLRHRHVVGIHDVGRTGDHHYIAMEYLPGGPVSGANGLLPSVPFVLRVVREIALALHYAHGKGVVHRDVKPDNILLREDAAAALTDFGIARAADAMSSMTRTGSVIGTPHYMSPEQARGQPLDGRADLYSLGIVLYELLLGEVPFAGDEALAVGIKHLTAPVPRLPDLLSPLQPILDGLMAKDPEQRFQNGATVAAAIESIEAAILAGELPTLGNPEDVMLPPLGQRMTPPFTPRIATPAPRTPPSELRGEPVLGELSAAEIERPARRRQTPARRTRRWPWLMLVVAAGGIWAYLEQDRLRALIPRTELNVLLVDAERAFQEGRLHGDARSAEALYRAVLDFEPDHDVARSGLRKVAEAQAGRARQALQDGDISAAREWLRAARAAGAPPAALGDIEAALREADCADQVRAEGLEQARRAAAEGRIEGADDAAVPQLLLLLERHPDDRQIEAELDRLAALLLDDVAGHLVAGDEASARARIDSVTSWRPRHPGLVQARAALAEFEEMRRADIDHLLQEAESRLRRGRLTTPAGDSALDRFREVLTRWPDNSAAQAGIRRVASGLAAQADRALGALELDRAAALIDEAEALAPDLGQLGALRVRLRDARERALIAVQVAELSEAQRFERDRLLRLAEAAEQAGQLLYPPGDSAYDRYRAVLALDPRNAEAMAGLQRLPEAAAQRAQAALDARQLNAARGFVEGLGQLAPGDRRLPALRRATADALLASGQEQLAGGQRQRAMSALEAAREIDPEHPGIDALARALREE